LARSLRMSSLLLSEEDAILAGRMCCASRVGVDDGWKESTWWEFCGVINERGKRLCLKSFINTIDIYNA